MGKGFFDQTEKKHVFTPSEKKLKNSCDKIPICFGKFSIALENT